MAKVCVVCMEPMIGDEAEDDDTCSLCQIDLANEEALYEEELAESYKYMEDHPEEDFE